MFGFSWWTDANGGGIWDSDMAGVDHEEVGFKEVWEGMGSTSLGGMGDWHWFYVTSIATLKVLIKWMMLTAKLCTPPFWAITPYL